MKQILFHPEAYEIIKNFTKELRRELGEALYHLQQGKLLSMPLSKPMSSIASGVSELRFKDENGIYRVFYAVKYEDAVWVIHAFAKKTQKTPRREIELGQKRFKEFVRR